MNLYDIEKPVVLPGQLLCDGCWATSGLDLSGWHTFNFRYLKQTTLCPKCSSTNELERLQKLQEQGL